MLKNDKALSEVSSQIFNRIQNLESSLVDHFKRQKSPPSFHQSHVIGGWDLRYEKARSTRFELEISVNLKIYRQGNRVSFLWVQAIQQQFVQEVKEDSDFLIEIADGWTC